MSNAELIEAIREKFGQSREQFYGELFRAFGIVHEWKDALSATSLDTIRIEVLGEARAVTMPASVWLAHRDIAQEMLNANIPEHAFRNAGFVKACGMLWGYFNSPETLFRDRFGEVRNPWEELKRLMQEGE